MKKYNINGGKKKSKKSKSGVKKKEKLRAISKCRTKKCQKKVELDAYTPSHNRSGGSGPEGGGALTAQEYLRAAWAYAYRAPADLTRPMTGVEENRLTRVFDYLRNATSYAMEHASNLKYFADGLVEVDTARGSADRRDPKTTEHRGRTGIVVARDNKDTAYFRVQNKRTQKGAPTPPEDCEEVDGALGHMLGQQVILCADGAHSFRNFAKKKNMSPVAFANHAKKEYVKLHSIPAPPGSGAHKLLKTLGHPEKRKLRVKGGDNLAEAGLGAVKSVLRRRGGLKNNRHIGSAMLAAAYSRHFPGLKNLGKAVKVFLDRVVDIESPKTYWVPARQHAQDVSV